jgi:hypothetical protein
MILDMYLDENGKFIIPSHIKNIRLDIGLSYCAPNSTIWLKENPDTFVIGVEANKYACARIISNGFIAHQRNLSFSFPHNNFILLNVALDNVTEKTKKPFYHMAGDVGVSSLLKPTNTLGDSIAELSDVDVVSLSYILEKIDWNRFEYIELVKIDTQGKDLDIIKSAGNYLDKIVYLNCEINTFNHYEDNPKPDDYDKYLLNNGFDAVLDNCFVNNEVVDRTYINKKYMYLKDKINNFIL